MILKSNIWRAIVTARMQFVFHLRGKKGAVMPRGGHFAAMEEPDLFVDDVRAWARSAG